MRVSNCFDVERKIERVWFFLSFCKSFICWILPILTVKTNCCWKLITSLWKMGNFLALKKCLLSIQQQQQQKKNSLKVSCQSHSCRLERQIWKHSNFRWNSVFGMFRTISVVEICRFFDTFSFNSEFVQRLLWIEIDLCAITTIIYIENDWKPQCEMATFINFSRQ